MVERALFLLFLLYGNALYGVVFQYDTTDTKSVITSFNAVVLNDFSTNSEVEGRLLVVNDVNGTQISNIAFKLNGIPSTDQSFVVGGNVNVAGNIQVQNGAVILKNSTSTTIQNAPGGVTVDSTLDLSGLANTFTSFSNGMAGLSDNSTYTANGNAIQVTIPSNLSGLAVVTIDGADLANAQNVFTYSGLSNVDALVVNVVGVVTNFYAPTNDATASSKVVYNFTGEEDITIKGAVKATIVAPDSTVTNEGSAVDGTVVALNLDQGNQELHLPNISGEAVDAIMLAIVPEISAYSLILGLFSTVVVARRRR